MEDRRQAFRAKVDTWLVVAVPAGLGGRGALCLAGLHPFELMRDQLLEKLRALNN